MEKSNSVPKFPLSKSPKNGLQMEGYNPNYWK